MKKQELNLLCLFTASIYVRYWNETKDAPLATMNDRFFLRMLMQYNQCDKVSDAAIRSIKTHTGSYQRIYPLAFSEAIDRETNLKMVQYLKFPPENEQLH